MDRIWECLFCSRWGWSSNVDLSHCCSFVSRVSYCISWSFLYGCFIFFFFRHFGVWKNDIMLCISAEIDYLFVKKRKFLLVFEISIFVSLKSDFNALLFLSIFQYFHCWVIVECFLYTFLPFSSSIALQGPEFRLEIKVSAEILINLDDLSVLFAVLIAYESFEEISKNYWGVIWMKLS